MEAAAGHLRRAHPWISDSKHSCSDPIWMSCCCRWTMSPHGCCCCCRWTSSSPPLPTPPTLAPLAWCVELHPLFLPPAHLHSCAHHNLQLFLLDTCPVSFPISVPSHATTTANAGS